MTRTYTLPHAVLTELEHSIHTRLNDGAENVMLPPATDPDYLAAVAEMGYSSVMRYAIEHEIAHHIIAGVQGPEPSRIIYRACHCLPMSMDEPESANEEHLVNRLQRWVNLGEPDPYGNLEALLGDKLAPTGRWFLRVARPWLWA